MIPLGSTPVFVPFLKKILHLTLEGERGADLVAGLVELGGVEGEAEAEGGAGVELGAVGEGSNAAVVDLDLLFRVMLAIVSEAQYAHAFYS